MARLGVAIIGVILINGSFSFWQEFKAERAIAALRELLPRRIKVLRDSKIVQLLADKIVPGDIILLEEGDSVPADCRLIESLRVLVNTATLTGESLPSPRNVQPSNIESPLYADNLLLAGTSLVSGQARGVVYATGMHTEFGHIAHLAQTAGEVVSPLIREITRLSRLVAMLATGLGMGFFAIGQVIGLPFWENMLFAIGIIVANVPEGLLPTMTLSLAMATQRMARRNALVRHLPSVEALGSTTVIVTDKTGTLTQNRMSVCQVWINGEFKSPDEINQNNQDLLCNAALCNDVREINGSPLGDPTEIALKKFTGPLLGSTEDMKRLGEIPFDTERKRMSVTYVMPDGLKLYCKGALEAVLPLCRYMRTGDEVTPLADEMGKAIIAAQEKMAASGLRVLAFAYRSMAEGDTPEEENLAFSGLVGLQDSPRPEVPLAINRCETAGIKVIMCTGDHPRTAVAIAREIGLARSIGLRVITGEEMQRMSASQLQIALDAPEILFARMGPEQKMRIVEALKRKGEIVAVTGDGVNDAPALKSADIGVAMGIAGTDVAKEVADLILLDDNFASIVAAVEEGRAVFENIRKFMTYILTSNIPEIVPYLAFVLFSIPLPLTIIQILAVDLGTDMLPALALGAEPPDSAIMKNPPRKHGERLLTWGVVARAYLFLGVFEAAAALFAFFYVLHGAGWHYGQAIGPLDPVYLQATTACLVAIIVTQMANLFLCRDPAKPVYARRLSENPLILLGLAVELAIILAIVYTPGGQWVFGTAAINFYVWLMVLPFVAMMMLAEEVRKVIVQRGRK